MADRNSLPGQIRRDIRDEIRRGTNGAVQPAQTSYPINAYPATATEPQVYDEAAVDDAIDAHDIDPDSHDGIVGKVAIINRVATRAPLATDDTGASYSIGSLWVWGSRAWLCLDPADDAAVWWEKPFLAAAMTAGRVVTVDANGHLIDSGDAYVTGRLGVGMDAQANYGIASEISSTSTTAIVYGMRQYVTLAPTGASSAQAYTIAASPRTVAGNNYAISRLVGHYGAPRHEGGGNISNGMFALQAAGVLGDASAGTVAAYYGFYGSALTKNAGSTVTLTNCYGAYLARQTVGGTNYQYYSAGGTSLLMAGDPAIKPLLIRAAAAQTANLQEWQDSVGSALASIDKDGVIKGSGYKSAAGNAGASKTTGGLTFENGLLTSGDVSVNGNVPTGGIIMWSGAANAIPSGWLLCDGTEGTPDLRNRFIVGAGDDYAVGDSGGSATSGLPAHSHGVTAQAASTGGATDTLVHTSTGSGGAITVATTAETGTGTTVTNLPPYYALCFIMKE
jgi:hypothetical protein